MSFSNNIENCTNASDKVCIQAKKVFDACLKQVTQEGVTLTLTNTSPANPALPLTFVSGRSLSSVGVVTNLVVDRLPEKPKCGRVQCDVSIPVEISYTDNNGVDGSGSGMLTLRQDVVMSLPDPSIVPYEIEAVVSAVCPDGFYLGTATIAEDIVLQFSVVACISIILKIVTKVDLIVPTFGYAVIPPCQEFTQEVCEGFFELPLFPDNG
ncbi:MAG: hypothetical protein IJV77_07680 [Clostridia bacterium]|nr:hypothetical protein [Clostridia bacterium]